MYKFYQACLLVCLLPVLGWSQNVLKGRITATDAPDGLPGAAIQVVGAQRGTVSTLDGSYTLNLQPSDSVISVSYIGYGTERVSIAGKESVDVVLKTAVKLTEEVVVIGYGTVNKSDLSGSVSSVRGGDLTKVPNNNAVQSLQGKVTGVNIQSPSGEPGQAPTVRIRGVGTLSSAGNNPLYVVDGVFMDDINAINSQDIESIEVLKDASAAAIFGVRGANGVILVTTKKGKAGKPTFSFSTEVGLQNLPRKIPLLTGRQYGVLMNEISPGTYNNLDRLPNTDWQDLVYRKDAIVQNHQFSASGGGENSTYYFGLGYYEQQGLVPNSYYQRISLRANNSLNITKGWLIGTNLTVTPTVTRTAASVTATAYRNPPNIAPYSDTTPSPYTPVNTYGNPLADLEYTSNNYTKGVYAVGNLYTELKIWKGLKYRLNVGYDFGSTRYTSFVPQFFVNAPQSSAFSVLSENTFWRSNTMVDNLLYYTQVIGKHSIDAFGGMSTYRYFNTTLSARAQSLLSNDPSAWYLNTGVVPANGATQDGVLRTQTSFLGRVNYVYDGKYTLSGTIRADGSSLFASQNRWGYFPSVAVAWNVAKEAFMEDIRAINLLKIRASTGRLGNQAVDGSAQNTRYNLINAQTPAVFGPGNQYTQGAAVGITSNPNIKWETTTQTDVGVEVGVLNNRLSFEADYYYRATSNILAALPTPGYYGNGPGASVTYNAANVTNSGFEGNVQWRDEIQGISYRLGALATTVKNNVTNLGSTGQGSDFISSGSVSGSNISRTQVGNAIGSFYGYQVAGVYQSLDDIAQSPKQTNVQPGDLKFKDQNGDGVIDDKDRVILGTSIPKFIFGFSAGVGYMGFDLSADFQGQTGNKIYNAKEVERPGETNFEARYLDRWTPANPSSSMPRATNNGNNYLPSDFFLQSGDFLRLRTLTLAYKVPASLLGKYGIQALNIYVRGTNLKTWTSFTGYTPEIGAGSDLSAGLDRGIYPLAKVWAIGANVTF
jgi:TonB-linked SusC/RagA family outer membrane protein